MKGSLIAVMVGGVGLILTALGFHFYRFYHSPLHDHAHDLLFEIPSGTSLKKMVRTLDFKVHFEYLDRFFFEQLARYKGLDKALQAGEYRLGVGEKPIDVLTKMHTGKVQQHKIQILEGWTAQQVLQQISIHPFIEKEVVYWPPAKILQYFQWPYPNLEGVCFPDTYYFPRYSSDKDVLRKCQAELEHTLEALWKERDPGILLSTPYEALILASLIEKETALKSESQTISGVFHRRLKRNMPLQTDPSVIYALGTRYQGTLTKADLKVDSPYNTYRYKGLPPTPICVPSYRALSAAMHPDQGDALYFVAKGNGAHHFSTTLEAHNAAVKHYILDKEP